MVTLRWPVVIAIAVALHAAMFLTLDEGAPSAGADSAGEDGLLISLAPAGGDSGSAAPETATPEPVSEARPVPEPESEPDPRIVETEPEPDPESPAEPEPDPEPEPEPESEPREADAELNEETVAGRQARAGVGSGSAASVTDGTSGGGNPGARVDYLTRVRALLMRHKEYPRRARRRRLSGVVEIAFTIQPDGRITNVDVRRSAGAEILDLAARAMLDRAGPLPPPPGELGGRAIEVTLPVRYAMR